MSAQLNCLNHKSNNCLKVHENLRLVHTKSLNAIEQTRDKSDFNNNANCALFHQNASAKKMFLFIYVIKHVFLRHYIHAAPHKQVSVNMSINEPFYFM